MKRPLTNGAPRAIELLAPARNADIGIEAIRHGADAVYIGAQWFGARAAAGNPPEDIANLIRYAHSWHARVYVTLNTILLDSELEQAQRLVWELYAIGADALIIQDMGLLRLELPPIELHASTQCDIRTPERALFLKECGMSRLILPRELTLEETRAIADGTGIEIEAFVHGALCVSYSGDCHAGAALTGRSANRGECPQICRHLFSLEDETGHEIRPPRHYLSLRDLNRSSVLEPLLEAGVTSLKIEGRLKDAAYVKNIVGYYRQHLDRIIAAHPDRYTRASIGRTELTFTPDPESTFNRGFTTYFTNSRRPDTRMASMLTPKWAGRRVGTVEKADGCRLKCRLDFQVNNADGLTFFTPQGKLEGFNVNTGANPPRGIITTQRPTGIRPGTEIFRNFDKATADTLGRNDTGRRVIDISLTLRATPFGIALDAYDETGKLQASVSAEAERSTARSPQTQVRHDLLCRTGGTQYSVTAVNDTLDADIFIPKSVLSTVRRQLIDALSQSIAATHPFGYRLKESASATLPEGSNLSYHYNVANSAARDFYRSHGATAIEPAIESSPTHSETPIRVMTTRYCLRRELGACLRTPTASSLPERLFLHSGPIRLALNFDCKRCEMHVVK